MRQARKISLIQPFLLHCLLLFKNAYSVIISFIPPIDCVSDVFGEKMIIFCIFCELFDVYVVSKNTLWHKQHIFRIFWFYLTYTLTIFHFQSSESAFGRLFDDFDFAVFLSTNCRRYDDVFIRSSRFGSWIFIIFSKLL